MVALVYTKTIETAGIMDFWILFLHLIFILYLILDLIFQAYQFPPITHPNSIAHMAGWNKDSYGSLDTGPGEGQCNIIPEKVLLPGTGEHLRRISDLEREEEEVQSLRNLIKSTNREKHLQEKITTEIMKLREELRWSILEDFSNIPGAGTTAPTLGSNRSLAREVAELLVDHKRRRGEAPRRVAPAVPQPATYQNLSMEVAQLLRDQRLEDREREEREIKAVADRERLKDEIKFRELKTQVKILQNGILDTYVKSPSMLSKLTNSNVRSLLVSIEKGLPPKLEEMQILLSQCVSAGTLLGKQRDEDLLELQKNVADCTAQGRLTIKSLEGLMDKRGIPREKLDPASYRGALPTFEGLPGSNIFTFEKSLERYLVRREVAEEDKGLWLMESLKGPALQVVKEMTRDRRNCMETSWTEAFTILKSQFGDGNDIRRYLISQHAAVGKLPEIPTTLEWGRMATQVSEHLSLILEALDLQKLFQTGNMKIPVINQDYMRSVMGVLTPADRMTLRRTIPSFAELPLVEQLHSIQEYMEFILKNARQEAKQTPKEVRVVEERKTDEEDSSTLTAVEWSSGGDYLFKKDGTCFICESLALAQGASPEHRPHYYNKRKRLVKTLCPALISKAGMRERIKLLSGLDICLACLKSKTSDRTHGGEACDALSKVPALKCVKPGCRLRAILCEQHVVSNSRLLSREEELEMILTSQSY